MPRWTGLVLLAGLLAHALIIKLPQGLLPEMLYGCHIATTIMAIGLLFDLRSWVAMTFLFHVGVGFWGFLLDMIALGTTTPTSVIIHVLPIVFGFFVTRKSGLPRWAPFGAWSICFVAVIIAYVATPPRLNVNIAHMPWPPLERFVPGLAATWTLNLTTCIVLLLIADRLLRFKNLVPSEAT